MTAGQLDAVVVPAGVRGAGTVRVLPGPRLLAGCSARPSLASHRTRWAAPRTVPAHEVVALAERVGLRGRGGAGFPVARKLATVLDGGRRRAVVVNASEGEPASAKDSALLLTAPHLVLDGAEAVARSLRVRTVHVVVPGERPEVRASVVAAVGERDGGPRWRLHETSGGFVGGQSRAVVELVEGRTNLPVTSWAPEAVSGVSGRPTLLSNAETFAQVAALLALGPDGYAALGTAHEPGTTLLTVAAEGSATVVEVPHGSPLLDVLATAGCWPGPVLVGGYHGTWLPGREVQRRLVSPADLREAGASLGAGVVLPLPPDACPVDVTATVVDYLAGQSAGRCGPCRNGLPALARAAAALASGGDAPATRRVLDLVRLVERRGACAHPDGTARLVRSLLAAFPGEVAAHEAGRCGVASGGPVR